ncbi:serine kinase [Variovorax paradoxus]|nr:serine kinase [Variovorax paradoxus]
MAIDWKLLIDVRERQKSAAMGIVARDRRAAEESLARLQQAEARRQQQVQNKAQHWQATVGALSDGQCSIAQLRHAGAWSGALDAQIAQAGRATAQAGQAHAQRELLLEASRKQLRAASGELEKAQQMQQRARTEALRVMELRQDETAEEAASKAWAARRF